MFFEKNILIGISGGIAVYKIAELVRAFKKNGANVRIVMTHSATRFVSPLTFETLSEHDVLTDLFPEGYSRQTAHIDWARWADIFIIAPATLNTIGKIASGIADNALTTTVMAATIPVVFCPAMNKAMYANSLYKENEQKLLEHGYSIVSPGVGELACGELGEGRLADVQSILDTARLILFGTNELKGKKVLVTAGPTEEPLDPVRFLTNRSSGKMGFALAEQAKIRGADVTLVSGPTQLLPFSNINHVTVRTAQQMHDSVFNLLPEMDVLIMAAAVSDYRPDNISAQKLKKADQTHTIDLTLNPDILHKAGLSKGNRIHVGFSVETQNELEHSMNKLQHKKCDIIVINNPLEKDAGFQVDTNKVTILDKKGAKESLPVMSKNDVANVVIDKIIQLFTKS